MRSLPSVTGLPATVTVPALQRQLTQEHLEQRGLAGPVRPEHRDELACTHREVEVVPQHPVAEREAATLQVDDVSSLNHVSYRFVCGALSNWPASSSTVLRCHVR